jgi:hypothetical protein
VVPFRRILSLCGLIALTLVSWSRPASAQTTSDIIRGRVTGPDSQPVPNVVVKATSYSGSVTKTARTDRRGSFTIIFVNGEGDYWLEFSAMGFAPKRFEIKKVGDEEVMLANTRLTSTITTLDQVVTTASGARALTNRNATSQDVGGGDRTLTTNAAVPPDQAGNLAAMASAIPGIQLIPGLDGAGDMFSALGLSGDQNNTTFNGLGSGLNTLPPDAQVRLSFNQFPWDVSRGGFSGAQISISSIPGSNYSFRNQTGYGTAPQLQWTDDNADSTGQKSTTLRYGGSARGAITQDKAFYNAAYSFQRRFADALTLLNASPLGLAAAGVAADSVDRLLDILSARKVPVSVSKVPSLNATDQFSLQSNVDLMPSSSGTGHSFTLGTNGFYSHTRPTLGGFGGFNGLGGGSLLTTAPSRTNNNQIGFGSASLTHSNYFWFGILSQSTLGLSAQSVKSTPFLQFPSGTVRVNSIMDDGSSSIRSLSFGGSQSPFSQNTQNVQLSNVLSWYSSDSKHAIKLTSNIAREHNTNQANSNLLGSYTFNSLADLEAGRPASFTRTLNSVRGATDQISGGVSLGDAWRPTGRLQLQYGVRVDGNRFLYKPANNPAVRSAFGIDNDVVPNKLYVSPRIGLQWTYGNAPQVAFVPGAARPPLAVIHAGAGIFQNIGPATLINGAVVSTGLANSTQSLVCVGAAAPTPNWENYLNDLGTLPTQCADGTSGTVFSAGTPSVMAFDRNYRQPAAYRTAVDWSSPVLDNRFVLGAQAVYSWNVNQQAQVDLNLNNTTRFTLDNEGGRPVYAPANAIVPLTGAIASAATRRNTAFQRMTLQTSDLRSQSTNFVFKLVPVTANKYLRWQLTYSLLNVRDEFNGFSSTVGDPFAKQWGPHLQSGRHQFQLNWSSFPVADLVYFNVSVGVKSGSRFTPLVSGDVNGDGSFFNDRAFVFDPASISDPTLKASMETLLASGAPAARSCLRTQLNALASRGSCQAPWVTTTNLNMNFNAQKIGLPKRLTINLSFTNPLGIADLLVNGSKNAKGWGQEIPPDQNLLFVRGFDPVTNRFKYEVNQRFGSTLPQQSVSRTPAYASLTFGFDIGAPRERQILTQRLDAGRRRPGTKQTAPNLKALGSASIPNPMALILSQQDSLKLNRKQADSLASLSRRFTQFADSVWTPVSKQLEAMPDRYNRDEAYDRYVHAREATVDYLITLVPEVKKLLTSSQRRKLPSQITNFLDLRVLKFLRSSSAGDISPFMFR